MSDYRVIHRKQDLGMKISSLYRQEQLAVGIIDVSSGSDLESTLKWFVSSFDFSLHVITTEERADEMALSDLYPEVTFILFKSKMTIGDYINALADVCYTTYFLVFRSDAVLIEYDGSFLMNALQDRNHPSVITPLMLSEDGEVMPTLRAPFLRGREFDPLSFTPTVDETTLEANLYPQMGLGLYYRALFQLLTPYDTQIGGDYYHAADFWVRSHLLGHPIFTSRALSIQFPSKRSLVEDRSECEGMARFYTKALSIRRIAGKNVVEKWKPYVDKELLNSEVKKKQVIIQKTDFFSLMKNWKGVEAT